MRISRTPAISRSPPRLLMKKKCKRRSTADRSMASSACSPLRTQHHTPDAIPACRFCSMEKNSNTASIVSGFAAQTVARYSQSVMNDEQRVQLGQRNDIQRRTALDAHPSPDRADARVVQSRVEKQKLLYPRRRREYHHAGDALAHRDGHRARKRNRNHGAIDGDAHTPLRADAGQDAALRSGGNSGRRAGHHRGAAGISYSVSRQPRAAVFLRAAVPDDHPGRGAVLSTISQTQQQAMMGVVFLHHAAFMLSGFAFPIRNMPAVVQ